MVNKIYHVRKFAPGPQLLLIVVLFSSMLVREYSALDLRLGDYSDTDNFWTPMANKGIRQANLEPFVTACLAPVILISPLAG